MGGCWQVLIDTCQCEWFETTVVSYGSTILRSGKVIVKLSVFCGEEVFLILMLILVQFWGFWPGGGGGGGCLNTLRKTQSQPRVSLWVAWCILHFGQVSLKSVRWLVSHLPGPLMNSVLIAFNNISHFRCSLMNWCFSELRDKFFCFVFVFLFCFVLFLFRFCFALFFVFLSFFFFFLYKTSVTDRWEQKGAWKQKPMEEKNISETDETLSCFAGLQI